MKEIGRWCSEGIFVSSRGNHGASINTTGHVANSKVSLADEESKQENRYNRRYVVDQVEVDKLRNAYVGKLRILQ